MERSWTHSVAHLVLDPDFLIQSLVHSRLQEDVCSALAILHTCRWSVWPCTACHGAPNLAATARTVTCVTGRGADQGLNGWLGASIQMESSRPEGVMLSAGCRADGGPGRLRHVTRGVAQCGVAGDEGPAQEAGEPEGAARAHQEAGARQRQRPQAESAPRGVPSTTHQLVAHCRLSSVTSLYSNSSADLQQEESFQPLRTRRDDNCLPCCSHKAVMHAD